ncbi:MAG: site-specific integrase [Deltaproteobacteria bacterium]|nr:site-specific integrase [Deltaproteobacteria bacterium]
MDSSGKLSHILMPTDEELQGFHKWLRKRGRCQGTADLYTYQVRRSYTGGEDPLDRLLDDTAAPKTLHSIASALRAWAQHTRNDALKHEISEISLPAASRISEKKVLTRKQWLDLRQEIDQADYIDDPVRGVLGLMAARGFRRGDVLRLTRDVIKDSFTSGTLTYVAKGRRRLSFPVTRHWEASLKLCYPRKDETVAECVSPGHTLGAAEKTVSRALTACGEEVGIAKINPHLLRKTYATYYYEACKDPVKLKDHMQWAAIETAMLYVAQSSQKDLEAVADTLFEDQ